MVGSRPSRCLDTDNAPLELQWAVIESDPVFVKRALLLAVKDQVPQAALVDAWGEVQAILQRYEQCLAIDPDDIKPIARHAHLWELRIELEAYGVLLRVYEAEVPELPSSLVALHAHRKVIGATEDETKRAQDVEIFIAIRRFDTGRRDRWGLV